MSLTPPRADSPISAPDGIDGERVGAWLEANVEKAQGPFQYEQIAGGRSNLTYSVTDAAGHRWALRRPPLGKALGSAHDMGREHTVIAALVPTRVPVPPIAGYCADESVNGAPFYLMDFLAGPVLRQRDDAGIFPALEDRRAIGERVVDTLVEIHSVVPDRVGLGELGAKEDYVKRQLRRWGRQWEKSKTRDVPLVEEVAAKLSKRVPPQGPVAIVHGDYRLDNVILDHSGHVAAVVDWELCTLGDPLADVGLLLVYWGEDGASTLPMFEPATLAPGFPSREDVKARYAERSGRDLSGIDFYVALGYWKLAIILEGVHARFVKARRGEPIAGGEAMPAIVDELALAASAAAQRLES